jgi:hypothetical protein
VTVESELAGGVASDVDAVELVLAEGFVGKVPVDRPTVGVLSDDRVVVALSVEAADCPPVAPQLARKPTTKSPRAAPPKSSGRSTAGLRLLISRMRIGAILGLLSRR